MDFVKRLVELCREDLPLAGGKGANLGALMAVGLPVPPGFVVTTAGYRAFVEQNRLAPFIEQALESAELDNPAALELISQQIRDRFVQGIVPEVLAAAIREAYAGLGGSIPVAVRSSATAEDLPDLSFAGQQDTYLNIVGSAAVLEAVVRCWGSLWTARAIGYRARNGISQDQVALAAVVQQMVQSEASGVLFTANPLTGKRDETVIDATIGLGEALVSGQVDPDHYAVDRSSGQIVSKTLGAKALSIRGTTGGGTVTLDESAAERQALPDAQIMELVRLGETAARAFGGPQDMEWAWADETLYIVQSRPITSLYPLPAGAKPDPFEVYFSFGVWQGMLDPYTPLGRDVFSYLIAGMAKGFQIQLRPADQRVFLEAGERIFVNITELLRNEIGRNIAGIFISSIDPVSRETFQALLEDPRLALKPFGMGARLQIARGVAPVLLNVLYALLFPRQGRARQLRKIEAALEMVRRRCATDSLAELGSSMDEVMLIMPSILLHHLLSGVIAGQAPLQLLLRLAAGLPGGAELPLELTRGLPHNVTTEMDLALWQTASAIRADTATAAYFSETETDRLVAEYRAGTLPAVAQAAVAKFLDRYGLRGVGEIDMGRPRWIEDPAHVFQVLKSYLQITAEEQSPEAVFVKGSERALQAKAEMIAAFRRERGGWFKARLAGWLAERVRELGGLRETPKFVIVRMLGQVRLALLARGEQLVAEGALQRADDLFFLHLDELRALGNRQPRDWQGLVAERRAAYQRELRRKRMPRMMLSDGLSFYDGAVSGGDGVNTLSGSPVSPGMVEGVVHVVLNPQGEQLVPGEILVCPATDPAWTPLFLAAGGLVMEVGGMMTHGSVVAREYGIPAVVGVVDATTRLQNGQKVRVDGSSGRVEILG